MNEEEKTKEIERLQSLLRGQEESARLLVRRDLELTKANEKLETLGQLKSDFVSVVAHQLRTPLSVTKWAFDMLWDTMKETLTPEEVSMLIRGKESNERMISLVDDLLNVNLHDAGKVQYVFSNFSIEEVVNKIVEQLMPVASKRNIHLEFISKQLLPDIYGDSKKIGSVVQNFVENALKYTPKKGEVIVRTTVEDSVVTVSVQDTGIGVPKAEFDKLFTKFYRGENAIKTVTEGSGLGLFISQKIIRRHGGKIWFESDEGKGSTFYFSVPITK